MSFKHTKFDDSESMRSFAKVGVEKGLVTPETSSVVKTASSKISATGDLVQDVMILCASLRKAGMEKHAEDLENNFLLYKKSESLYETFKETGEDLVDMAHPEGSHKLQDLEHTVLTITDRHKKIKDIVNKKPTGKLDDSLKRLAAKNNSNKNKLNIIKNSFKMSFAQESDSDRQMAAKNELAQAAGYLKTALDLFQKHVLKAEGSSFVPDPRNNWTQSLGMLQYCIQNIESVGFKDLEKIENEINEGIIEANRYWTGDMEKAKQYGAIIGADPNPGAALRAKHHVRKASNFITGQWDQDISNIKLKKGYEEVMQKADGLASQFDTWLSANKKDPDYQQALQTSSNLDAMISKYKTQLPHTQQNLAEFTKKLSGYEVYFKSL